MKGYKDIVLIMCGLLFLLLLSIWSLKVGDVQIDFNQIIGIFNGETYNVSWSYIIESRLNRTVMAILGGSALAVSGLILQVYFRNPLAGPGVLGVSSGVTLGVAIVILGGYSFSNQGLNGSLIIAGLLGALVILMILILLSKYIYQSVTLLIIGLMLSYFTSAFVNALYHWANLEQSRQFIVWGLGSFEGVDSDTIQFLIPIFLIAFFGLIFLIKPLNALVMGEDYAKSLGINIGLTKVLIILMTSLLTALVTVYCGPVAFIGIAVPQIVRSISSSKNHIVIVPLTLLIGALFALIADLFIRLSGHLLPLNTVTSLIGAPIIIWSIIRLNKIK
jgi:iron complex transport system permease protein